MYRYVKRSLDILISLLILPFLLITIILIGLLIRSDDKGPVFYMAERIGYHGRIFKMFKFRSMKVNAPDIRLDDGSTYNGEDDSRVTRVGKFLRKTSIDEIPQFLNILMGDMSFIGPRPDSAFYLDYYTVEERIILNVRPGLTGYNQAVNRNAVGTKEKIKNDVYYVTKISLIFDIKIIFWTIKSMIHPKNVFRANTDVDERQEFVDK